jgi:F-type H+-transporting ATPase subunit b
MLKIRYALAAAALVAACCLQAARAADGSAPSTAHAPAEQGSGHEEAPADPLKAPPELAVWTLVVFLILLAVLWKFAWGPIAAGLAKREQKISDQISQAEQTNREARQLLSQYQQQLAAAEGDVREILERGRREAERISRELVDKARQDAEGERSRALHEIEQATAGALKELAERSAAMAVQLAGRIVQADLDPRGHTRLIEQAMADFARHDDLAGRRS